MPSPNSLALIVSEISAFIRTDVPRSQRSSGQTFRRMAGYERTDQRTLLTTRLVILIKNILRKRFLMPVTFFPTNLVHPFTLRVTGIKALLLYE